MGTIQVILKETVESLGIIGSEVKVAKGYARNYLFPQGKAVEASDHNRRLLEKQKLKIELQIAQEKELAEQMAERVKDVVVEIRAKVAEENRLYGSVTARDIAEALKAKGVDVEKQMVLLTEPIKELGTYHIPIRVYKGVKPEITLEVMPEE